MSVEITVDPQNKIKDLLKKIREQGGNLTIPFMSFARSWFKSNKSIFLLQGPGLYQDLSAKYKIQKMKAPPKGAGFVYPIMRGKTGALEKSLTDPTDSNSINLVVNKVALYLGTKVPHAIFHQSPAPRKIIPFRPIVFLGVEQVAPSDKKADLDRFKNILEGYYEQLMKQAGA